MIKMIQKLVRVSIILALASSLAAVAFGDPLTVGISTSGSFCLDSNPNNCGSSAVGGLTFTGNTDEHTVNGPTQSVALNLGQFTLSPTFKDKYDPYNFKLTIDFGIPIGTTETVRADVTGSVSWWVGGATINFNPDTTHFTFDSSGGSGSFDLTIADVNLNTIWPSSKTLGGTISNASFTPAGGGTAAAPEPASIVLLGTMFGGLALFLRRRLTV